MTRTHPRCWFSGETAHMHLKHNFFFEKKCGKWPGSDPHPPSVGNFPHFFFDGFPNPQVAYDRKLLTVLYLKFFKICDICCSTNAMGEKSNIFLSTLMKSFYSPSTNKMIPSSIFHCKSDIYILSNLILFHNFTENW